MGLKPRVPSFTEQIDLCLLPAGVGEAAERKACHRGVSDVTCSL